MESVLPDNLRKKAGEKIRETAETLCNININDYSLMYGTLGIAMFLFYYWKWKKQNSFYKKASELTNFVFMQLSKQIYLYKQEPSNKDLSFQSGICGMGWGINHLAENGFIECDIRETMCLIDAALYRKIIDGLHSDKREDFREAMAVSLYALSRKDRLSKEYLRRFMKEWIELTDRNDKNIIKGYIPENEEIISFLLLKIKEIHPDIIPVSVKNILSPADNPQNRINVDLSHFKEKISSVTADTGLAGGLVSMGHKAKKIYGRTGNIIYREMAIDCFKMLLERTTPDGKLGGFTASRGLWGIHYGLANGLAGFGLALLAAITNDEVTWDECLLALPH
jgi:hypothetical protein